MVPGEPDLKSLYLTTLIPASSTQPRCTPCGGPVPGIDGLHPSSRSPDQAPSDIPVFSFLLSSSGWKIDVPLLQLYHCRPRISSSPRRGLSVFVDAVHAYKYPCTERLRASIVVGLGSCLAQGTFLPFIHTTHTPPDPSRLVDEKAKTFRSNEKRLDHRLAVIRNRARQKPQHSAEAVDDERTKHHPLPPHTASKQADRPSTTDRRLSALLSGPICR